MFRQLVTGANRLNNINSLFTYHPLQIAAITETVWLNRGNSPTGANPRQTSSWFVPWAPDTCLSVLNTQFFTGYDWSLPGPQALPSSPLPLASYVPPLSQPAIAGMGGSPPTPAKPTNWDHLIYAYIIENTRIFEIFGKVLETYMFTEQLETPTPESQLFWRNLEFLIFGDAVPSMLWTTSGRIRRDEIANRMTAYYWMFGIDLSHAGAISGQHPYQKPAASNRDFIPTFEAFAREVWRGIVNAKNTSGANDTDATVIATLARRIYDMMATRRINGNLSREEFRAVAVMSFLHLAVLYDSPAVTDLKAAASSPEMRLQKIAERVGMTAHPKSKPFFDLAAPFSALMQSIETNQFNQPSGAQLLYWPPSAISDMAEKVIDQYSLATGHDLKSQAVSVVPRSTTSGLPVPRRPAAHAAPQLPVGRTNGHATPHPQ
jgi:hypothetical protein